MDFRRPSVKLIRYTPDAEKLIEECGREAYGSPMSADYDGARKWIQARIRGWELDVLEHASATFLFDCTRVNTHQMVRHRIAAYSQQSQRFREAQEVDMHIVPPDVKDEDIEEWINDYLRAFSVFRKWRSRGYHKQAARYHLPEGSGTKIACTWNFRQIRHMVEMRCENKAEPEFHDLMLEVLRICSEKWPACFEDLKQKFLTL